MAALRSKLSRMPDLAGGATLGSTGAVAEADASGVALADGAAEGSEDADGDALGAGIGVGAGSGLGEPQRLSAITRRRSSNAPPPIAIVREEIGSSRGALGDGTGSTTGASFLVSGSGSGGAAMTVLIVPQSGQAGRFTGS